MLNLPHTPRHVVFTDTPFLQADLAVFSPSHDLGCQSCDCHALGSVREECDASSGKCVCQPHVEGRRCDLCEEGYAGMDEEGCLGELISSQLHRLWVFMLHFGLPHSLQRPQWLMVALF